MANYVSPGVYVLEKDTSDYPAAVNPSVVGIVGFASKGPVDKATLITSGERLISMFGKPDEDIVGQGLEGSLEILEATNSLYFVRSAQTSAVDASSYIEMGACPAVAILYLWWLRITLVRQNLIKYLLSLLVQLIL